MFFFFFNDTATTEIYTLSLHDALPIYKLLSAQGRRSESLMVWFNALLESAGGQYIVESGDTPESIQFGLATPEAEDRKSTRLNSSHANISYAVFCLKKKTTNITLSALS